MLVADSGYNANFSHTAEDVGGNIGATWMVTEIFCQEFFAPIRRCETRLDGYLRNGDPLIKYLMRNTGFASTFF